MPSTKASFQRLTSSPKPYKESMCYPLFKRLFDLATAFLGLLLLLPVGLLIAMIIKVSDAGPVFYGQLRIGRFGKPFRIWKFRSMVVNAEKLGLSVTPENDPRITGVGRFLRKTKLDELPQLWNVFIGEMSFVGPRPEVPRYVETYTPEQRAILNFKPGITDMATLLFRNEEALLRGSQNVEEFYVQYCLPRKITLNRQYAERATLAQDLWIIIQTLCPYWVGVVTIYSVVLAVSFLLAVLLRFDFQLEGQTFRQMLGFLPVMVIPQLFLLVWRGQVRGLLSYFSVPELRQTTSALSLALLIQFGVWALNRGRWSPSLSILLIHFFVSLVVLSGVRMGFRSMRERSSRGLRDVTKALRRVAIVGTGELATNLALDLSRNQDGGRRVVAFFDDNPHFWHKRPHDIPVVGMPECILNREWLGELDEVIVALPEQDLQRAQQIGDLLKNSRLNVTIATTWPLLRPLSA